MRIFDTTFIIDLINSDPEAASIARKVDEEGSFAGISVISAHEYLFGIYYRYFGNEKELRKRLSSAKRDLSRFGILPLTYDIVEISSKIHAHLERSGEVIGINDIYIASTALFYKLRVVTRNIEDFKRISGLEIETY
ncbi:MAG: type II toxin-antitoxin system VapC family toxin [archaeon]|nr:type II toxin-antitoxin system VapC family toxin [archaeon]